MQAISYFKQQQSIRANLGKTGTLLTFTSDGCNTVGVVELDGGDRVTAALTDVVTPQVGMKLRGCWRRMGTCDGNGLIFYGVKFCLVFS